MVDTYTVSDDKLVWTFTLREGLKFHDGAPVRSADAVASIKRWMRRHSIGKQMITFISSIEAVDEKTFTIKLKEPFGLVLDALGTPTNQAPFVLPEQMAKTDAFKQIKETIGSGPFKFVGEEWVPGSKTVYIRNEDYKPRAEPVSAFAGGKVAKVDRIEMIFFPDKTTAQAALSVGEVDILEFPPADLVPLMEKDPNIEVGIFDKVGYIGMIRFNHLHPPFNNVKARRAFMWAVDQRKYLKAAIGNPKFYEVCGSPFICGTKFGSRVGVEVLETVDLEKAKQLVKESGYDGRSVVVIDPADHPQHHAGALITAETLRKIGFKVKVEAIDMSSLFERRAKKEPPEKGGWNIFHTGSSGPGQSHPAINYAINASCKGDNWPGWPCSEEIQKLRSEFVRAADPAQQKEIAERLQKAVLEHGTHAFWGKYLRPYAYRKNIKGILEAPTPVYWNISKE